MFNLLFIYKKYLTLEPPKFIQKRALKYFHINTKFYIYQLKNVK